MTDDDRGHDVRAVALVLVQEMRSLVREQLERRTEPPASPWLTAAEAGVYLGCTASGVRRLAARREISPAGHGKRDALLFRREDLDAWVRRHFGGVPWQPPAPSEPLPSPPAGSRGTQRGRLHHAEADRLRAAVERGQARHAAGPHGITAAIAARQQARKAKAAAKLRDDS